MQRYILNFFSSSLSPEFLHQACLKSYTAFPMNAVVMSYVSPPLEKQNPLVLITCAPYSLYFLESRTLY
jgi:hypothetical protein